MSPSLDSGAFQSRSQTSRDLKQCPHLKEGELLEDGLHRSGFVAVIRKLKVIVIQCGRRLSSITPM